MFVVFYENTHIWQTEFSCPVQNNAVVAVYLNISYLAVSLRNKTIPYNNNEYTRANLFGAKNNLLYIVVFK